MPALKISMTACSHCLFGNSFLASQIKFCFFLNFASKDNLSPLFSTKTFNETKRLWAYIFNSKVFDRSEAILLKLNLILMIWWALISVKYRPLLAAVFRANFGETKSNLTLGLQKAASKHVT